jgi:hypothetical protein
MEDAFEALGMCCGVGAATVRQYDHKALAMDGMLLVVAVNAGELLHHIDRAFLASSARTRKVHAAPCS